MTESSTYFDKRHPLSPNPGLPRDLHPGSVATEEHRLCYAQPEVVELLLSDSLPIPAKSDRENYYDDRHIEYWISGYVDCMKMKPYFPNGGSTLKFLDFGGATGRVSRHMTRDAANEIWLCDINVNYIDWVDRFFTRPIHAFQNRILPPLPIEDGYFDLISAYSVFTHLDQTEMMWLLELRRILRPGGILYLTILDENVWGKFQDPNWHWLLKLLSAGNDERVLLDKSKEPLLERFVLEYSTLEAYNINTFLPRHYIQKKWGPLFRKIEFLSDHHNYQTAVVLQR